MQRLSLQPKRKGTRSVSSLTPTQLARKRANDREAQRAIRARTKEHIERLERELTGLKSGQARTKTVQELVRRNKALEEELERLREYIATRTASPPHSTSLDSAHTDLDSIYLGPLTPSQSVYDDKPSSSPRTSPLPSAEYVQYAQPFGAIEGGREAWTSTFSSSMFSTAAAAAAVHGSASSPVTGGEEYDNATAYDVPGSGAAGIMLAARPRMGAKNANKALASEYEELDGNDGFMINDLSSTFQEQPPQPHHRHQQQNLHLHHQQPETPYSPSSTQVLHRTSQWDANAMFYQNHLDERETSTCASR